MTRHALRTKEKLIFINQEETIRRSGTVGVVIDLDPPAIKQNALEWQVQVGVDTKTDRSFGNRSMSDHKVRRLGHYHLLYEVGVVLNERWVGADAGDFIRGGRV